MPRHARVLSMLTLSTLSVACSLLLKNTELEVKGTYFLIISLLVSSNTVVKETETFEKLFSFPVGRGYLCSAYVVCGNGPVVL